MSEDLQPYQFGPGDWSVADWSRMRGEAPTLVESGFPTRVAAQRRCRELRTGGSTDTGAQAPSSVNPVARPLLIAEAYRGSQATTPLTPR